jgi:hypothetical protein
MHAVQNEKGMVGFTLLLARPLHPKHLLQYSTTVNEEWISIPHNDILLDATGTRLFYQSGMKDKLFIRLGSE